MLSARSSLLKYVVENSQRGDAQSVIDTIDQFGWTQQWLMNIGDQKGKILDGALRHRRPRSVLELGTYLGYSSLRMASQLPDNVLIVSVEKDARSAEIARKIHQHAGMANRVNILVDSTSHAIPRLSQQFRLDAFDFIFIDHLKDLYLPDLKLLERHGLIGTGTMIVADNVITPGAPAYLHYIRNNPNYTSKMYDASIEYRNDVKDGVEVSVRK